MDRFHRKSQGHDTQIGRECEFCHLLDPAFAQRKFIDRLVQTTLGDTASAHLTEDGYVQHRIAELMKKRAARQFSADDLQRTA